MRKYHYLVLFMIGFLVLWPFMLHKLYIEQAKNTETFVEQAQAEGAAEPESGVYDVSGGEAQEEENKEAAKEGSSGQTDAEQETEEDTDLIEETEEPEEAQEDEEAEKELEPEEFFQDTLFIGDSRTMGLAEYADIGGAVVFANTGMNIYRLYSLKNAVHDQEPYLEDILAEKQYRKIYLMLGINELGYDAEQTVKRYEEEVLKLSELQPEAKIVLEANLHVTKERSERDAIFNNENIDRINENIRQIAEKHGFSYIDVNEIFDDETGGLNPECTHDEVHVLGKYYQQWADWIRENGI
ncbi:MAG: hypothetical protein HFI11_04145 [Lachnospiraceae bacterium]|nr:hypothetical protein [Lachnospiraceae bacterium]